MEIPVAEIPVINIKYQKPKKEKYE